MANIVLCAGHTPEATGAVNAKYNLNEYSEALVIVECMVDILKDLDYQVTTMTGKLRDKVDFINEYKPDLALDIHFNADYDHLDPYDNDDTRGCGCMVMYCPKQSRYGGVEPLNYNRKEQAITMSRVMSNVIKAKDLGGRQGWYWGSNPPKDKDYFLRKTTCPAFIPELGYIDNNKFCEDWLLANRHYELAEAIVRGILVHFEEDI